jgi:hypothetical protein
MVAGCKKCLAVHLCPLKSVIGDYEKPPAEAAPEVGKEEGEKTSE